MADTFTTNLNLTKPEPGAAEDTWGISLNSDLDTLDAIFSSSGTQINLNPNQVNFADNKKAIFGTGSDLQIYHDGSNSYIRDIGTGNLNILADQLKIMNAAGTENKAFFVSDGGAYLYHNNSAKLETTSTGIDVTGTITSDGLDVSPSSGDASLTLTSNSSQPWKIYSPNASNALHFNSDSTDYLTIDTSGKVGINTDSPSTALSIQSSGANGIDLEADSSATTNSNRLFFSTSAGSNSIMGVSGALTFRTGATAGSASGTERMRLDSSGNLLVGVTSTTLTGGSLTLPNSGIIAFHDAAGNARNALQFVSGQLKHGAAGAGLTSQTFHTSNVEAMRIDSSQRVGIGRTPTSNLLEVADTIKLTNLATGEGFIGYNTNGVKLGITATDSVGAGMKFEVGASERARIDASGNVGIGTTSPAYPLEVRTSSDTEISAIRTGSVRAALGAFASGESRLTSAGTSSFQTFYTGSTPAERMRIDSSGRVGIGTTSPDAPLTVHSSSDPEIRLGYSSTQDHRITWDSAKLFIDADPDNGVGNSALGFRVDGSEAGRFDASGNFMVGKTSVGVSTTGSEIRSNGQVSIVREGDTPLFINRKTDDGTVIDLRKDNSTFGKIGTSGGRPYLVNSVDGGIYLSTDGYGRALLLPADQNGAPEDNLHYLGSSSYRWRDIYLSGGHMNGQANALSFISGGNASNAGANILLYGQSHASLANTTIFRASGSESARIDSSGNFGLGTSSPQNNSGRTTLTISNSTNGGILEIFGASDTRQLLIYNTTGESRFETLSGGSEDLVFRPNGSEQMRVTSTGLGIGTDSPTPFLANSKVLEISDDSGIGSELILTNNSAMSADEIVGSLIFKNTDASGTPNHFAGLRARAESTFGRMDLEFYAGRSRMEGGTPDMVITPSGADAQAKVGIGTTSPNSALTVAGEIPNSPTGDGVHLGFRVNYAQMQLNGSAGGIIDFSTSGVDHVGRILYDQASDYMAFSTNTAERIRIDSSGNFGIGVTPAAKFDIYHGTSQRLLFTTTGSDNFISSVNGANSAYAGVLLNGSVVKLGTGGSERARIDSSGNFYVGTTDSTLYSATSGGGIFAVPNGSTTIARQSNTSTQPIFILNETGVDGTLQEFRKDGTTIGSIGVASSDNFYIGASASGHAGLYFDIGNMVPMSSNLPADNVIDLGSPLARFDDIYATNATIQTSDRNEKQDIKELSEAETRVAVAAKGLLKKFKFKSAVAEKGDEARIHFGIIAQDLQDAFTAEGLDASDYAMFCSNTWTDDDGVEQTRLGVRYSELLAFIIAAI